MSVIFSDSFLAIDQHFLYLILFSNLHIYLVILKMVYCRQRYTWPTQIFFLMRGVGGVVGKEESCKDIVLDSFSFHTASILLPSRSISSCNSPLGHSDVSYHSFLFHHQGWSTAYTANNKDYYTITQLLSF